METNWAVENLQTIRTLMERSAVYRRALAPIMLLAGALGVAAAATGLIWHLNSARAFGALWLGTALVAVAGALFVARRQAIKDQETFWSPPTRRVTLALLPPLLAGMCLGAFPMVSPAAGGQLTFFSSLVWIMFYGCALHAAGFFMPRGIRLFGWFFIAMACGLFYGLLTGFIPDDKFSAHWLMGFFFGGLHLAYGGYLYLTEQKNPVA